MYRSSPRYKWRGLLRQQKRQTRVGHEGIPGDWRSYRSISLHVGDDRESIEYGIISSISQHGTYCWIANTILSRFHTSGEAACPC